MKSILLTFFLSALPSSWAAAAELSFTQQIQQARQEWISTLSHMQRQAEERRRDMYYWDGRSCLNYLGEPGYVNLRTASRDLNLQRRNRLYREKHGECFNLQSEVLYNMDFKGGNLRGALASFANLSETRFNAAQLEGINLERSSLDRADLSGANLSGARLRWATLIGTRADEYTDFTGADLRESKLYGAQFLNADLGGADMREADLSNGFFNGANFDGANLEKAVLRNANLGAASLGGASFKKADLSGADLRSANMTSASFDRAELRGARYNSRTVLPSNWSPHDPQSRGMIFVREPWD